MLIQNHKRERNERNTICISQFELFSCSQHTVTHKKKMCPQFNPLKTNIGMNFYIKTNQIHPCTKLFYFEMTLYMFRTVFPLIIRTSRLYILQQAYVKQILLSACARRQQDLFDICLLQYVQS